MSWRKHIYLFISRSIYYISLILYLLTLRYRVPFSVFHTKVQFFNFISNIVRRKWKRILANFDFPVWLRKYFELPECRFLSYINALLWHNWVLQLFAWKYCNESFCVEKFTYFTKIHYFRMLIFKPSVTWLLSPIENHLLVNVEEKNNSL